MENQSDKILNKFQAEEKKARKRMFAYSSIPLALTVILILVSYLAIQNAGKEVTILKQEKSALEENITNLNTIISEKADSIAEMRKVMELAVNYKNKRYEFNFAVDKELYSRHPKQAEMLSAIRRMIEEEQVNWKLGGNSPETGFDSPSFASFMINRHSKTKVQAQNRYQLRNELPTSASPEVGDVVFYEHGYAMFYFEYRGKPFVVGMTPLGLSSLQYDFGPKRLGFGKVNY
ncbi:hypothetical protein [Draconibacterium halophilum]|uniref:Uncharacterized protein n=1 Tax=Draconibacterium halophilum TaxID=2706887 RepID=A0A6C0RFD2_9BACT|nr:hypothetical protein [Draconibacterium halophilum]QIA08777.1 hypothetical protein G0Q07_14075 [Draconibacterium halophilum]